MRRVCRRQTQSDGSTGMRGSRQVQDRLQRQLRSACETSPIVYPGKVKLIRPSLRVRPRCQIARQATGRLVPGHLPKQSTALPKKRQPHSPLPGWFRSSPTLSLSPMYPLLLPALSKALKGRQEKSDAPPAGGTSSMRSGCTACEAMPCGGVRCAPRSRCGRPGDSLWFGRGAAMS
jgi:hypothetical protein